MKFILNPRTRGMNNVQRWMCRTLLQQAFICDTRPYLPDNDDDLWLFADCKDKTEWIKNKDKVLKMFRREEVEGVSVLINDQIADDYSKFMRKQLDSEEKGYVYFIQATTSRSIKIGYASTDPLQRLNALRTGSSESLELLGCERAVRRKETELHKRWATSRLNGEWFTESPDLLAYIQENCHAEAGS